MSTRDVSPSTRNRSRSPHYSNRDRSGSISPKPDFVPLWRRRREQSEATDYENRLSPHRSLSPVFRERKSETKESDSWADATEDDNNAWLERAERAFSGLDKYEKEFKKYESPVVHSRNDDNKENANTNTPTAAKRLSPKPVAIEKDADVLIRRQRDIDYGKNTPAYEEFISSVPKRERRDNQPWTPDKYEKMTRRNWDKQVKIWRKQLHYWKDPKPIKDLLTPNTSPCPTPTQTRSPELQNTQNKLVLPRSLDFGDQNEETAMDSFANQITSGHDAKSGFLSTVAMETVEHNENSHMSCDVPSQLPEMFKN